MEGEKKQPGEELIDIDEKGNPIEKKEEKKKNNSSKKFYLIIISILLFLLNWIKLSFLQ